MRHALLLAFTCLLHACGESQPPATADLTLPDGGRYLGEVVEGVLHGRGRVDYPNGERYEGDFEEGRWHGQGIWQGATGDRYEGAFRHGLFHGPGRYSHAGGGRYEGEFRQGLMHGQGTFERDDLRYVGAFERDQYHGQGSLEYTDERYSGLFERGVLSGPGEYESSAGDRYEGDFQGDLFHGEGRFESATGEIWSGTFAEGEPSAPVRHQGIDGTVYEGAWRHWRYHGEGILTLPDGSRHEGRFRNGQPHGEGERVLADGTRQAGRWRNGRHVADEQGNVLPDPLELGLLAQGQLLASTLAAVPASTPAMELYSLTLAGDGSQSVFMRETAYVDRLLAERFAAVGQIGLVNHRDHFTDRPLATRENLARAIRTLAARSGPEDLVFLYFTSHGSPTHQLVLDQPRLALDDLPATELARLLEPLAERDKVVVISACYSGGFIEPLKDARTLVMTAARADRPSFGCSETSDFTYFGRALFAEALQQTRDLAAAFELASAGVAAREQADQYQPSEPQIWAPEGVLAHWQVLQRQTGTDSD